MKYILQSMIFIMALAVFSNFLPACKPYDNSADLKKVDTLERLVRRIDQTLIVDESLIEDRRDSMEIKLRYIEASLPDSGSAETKSNLTMYAGIKSNYNNFLDEYPVVKFDAEKHKLAVKQLKEKLVNKDISKSEFDKEYDKELKALKDINEQAKNFAFLTYSVEPEYRRTDKEINKIYWFYKKKEAK